MFKNSLKAVAAFIQPQKQNIMKYLSIIVLLAITLASCSRGDYYMANNRNIQKFDTKLEEQTAKYMLELHNNILLMESIASLTKSTTNSVEIQEKAECIERQMKKVKRELMLNAFTQNITLSSVLDEQNDNKYNAYSNATVAQRDEQFKVFTEQKLQQAHRQAKVYLETGENEKVQQFSIAVINEIETILEAYS